jgi:glycosyltransferase involved in cell wall biosynthesis
MFINSLFEQKSQTIPKDVKYIAVADLFIDDYGGGAELTTEALLKKSPGKVFKIRSKDLTLETIKNNRDKIWLFFNYASMNLSLISSIIELLNYHVIEYDFKYCVYRSPEKHQAATQLPCNCQNIQHSSLITALFSGAIKSWFMSQRQLDRYLNNFPQLQRTEVLSSVLDEETLQKCKQLRETITKSDRWLVCGTNSWIKGVDAAVNWCKQTNKQFDVVENVSHDEMLKKLASNRGYVFLPLGIDTCPRQVIEAKLVGCELELNDNVGHKDEEWFSTIEKIEEHMRSRPKRFWKEVNKKEKPVTLSGYLTVYDAVKQKYPFIQCIRSMLNFCDEVCIVDGGSTDGTVEKIMQTFSGDDRVTVKIVKRDWKHPRFAVFDGAQKAEARKMCSGKFCWQMDADEFVEASDVDKIRGLVQNFPEQADIVCLPVIEPWGHAMKFRLDVTPWKWRLSRNLPHITHGIPMNLRKYDANGNLCAMQGTDGCDLIDASSGVQLQNIGFYTNDAHNARVAALNGNQDASIAYSQWFTNVCNALPVTWHFSWIDIARKIRLYRDTWQRHWSSLYDMNVDDLPENNNFFANTAWKDVTEEMIDELAIKLETETTGWIFHEPWSGIRRHELKIDRKVPEIGEP